MRELSNRGLYLLHASQTISRGKRHGWTVVCGNYGRIQSPSYIPRRAAIRLFQHAVKAG